VTDADDLAVDDAIRSSSLHVLAGAALAMLLFTVAAEVGVLAAFAEASGWPVPLAWVPPYEQIRAQVATMAATGVLPVGTRLPPIRQLAKDLGLAGGTVARAYRELEAAGVIVTRGRHGSFVAEPDGDPRRRVADEALAEAAHAFAVQARQLGAEPEHALRLARTALQALGGPAGR
jgi:DNA-binding transcriptional regulator YhcF (GntR family)